MGIIVKTAWIYLNNLSCTLKISAWKIHWCMIHWFLSSSLFSINPCDIGPYSCLLMILIIAVHQKLRLMQWLQLFQRSVLPIPASKFNSGKHWHTDVSLHFHHHNTLMLVSSSGNKNMDENWEKRKMHVKERDFSHKFCWFYYFASKLKINEASPYLSVWKFLRWRKVETNIEAIHW